MLHIGLIQIIGKLVLISYVSVIGESPITTNIDLGPRQEGYVYKPHSLITIRSLSSYIEQGDTSVVGIPDYATDLGDGRFLWRDILDIGLMKMVVLLLTIHFKWLSLHVSK
jgi:hypothetical protein